MSLLIVLIGIIILVVLIVKKVNPMLALLSVSILTGLALGMPVAKVVGSVSKGIGDTLGSTIMVIALGAMIGKLAEESGAAQKIVFVLVKLFGRQHIQWAILLTGILAGIPLFYNAGFVVLIPLVFAIAAATKLPLLYVGMPMAAALSVTHGFLPPHPGPVALAGIFHADIGKTLLYGLAIAIPIAIIAGIVFPRIILKVNRRDDAIVATGSEEKQLPSAAKSFVIVLMPVFFIAAGTIGALFFPPTHPSPVFTFFQDPTIALLLSLFITILIWKNPMAKTMEYCVDGVKSIAMILLIIAAGGAFKQILIDSNVGQLIKSGTDAMHLSPLLLGWIIAALFRVTLGSATVAALTASGIVAPLLNGSIAPELMVLSVGAGSLMCSHVNDTGFWMFKEYFKLTLKQTFLTWTIMESIISVLGLAGVLVLALLF